MTTEQLERMSMWEVVKHVYSATYMRYSIKFHEEKMLRERVEERMLAKNAKIEELEAKVKELEDAAEESNS